MSGPDSNSVTWLRPYMGAVVVADLDQSYQVYGTLAHVDQHHLEFHDADLHDLREANSTSDVYAIETKQLGVRANRKRLVVPLHRVVAVAKIDEVLP